MFIINETHVDSDSLLALQTYSTHRFVPVTIILRHYMFLISLSAMDRLDKELTIAQMQGELTYIM